MPRPTLVNGNIWSENLANASLRPYISELDESGSTGELVKDIHLDNGTDQIKSRFYGWYNRLELTAGAGLTLDFNAASVRKTDGSKVDLAAGSVIVPANTSSFVYVAESPSVAVVAGPTLPTACAPLAWVTTNATNVVAIEDLREQRCEEIRVISLPSVQSPWVAGDTKESFRNSPEPGWLFCHGQSLNRFDYPALFSAIGYTHGGSGNIFNLPDCRGRVLVGAGTGSGLSAYALGAKGGAESVRIDVSQMPNHAHGVDDPGHNHAIVDSGHTHSINDPSHNHSVNDPGHNHPSANYRRVALEGAKGNGGAELSQVVGDVLATIVQAATTGISIISSVTGISVRSSKSNVSASPSTTGITINSQGGNAAHENRPPYIAGNRFIRVI